MAVTATKIYKRIEVIVKPYRFNGSNSVTKLSFLVQLKNACDLNGVVWRYENVKFTIFIARSSAASLSIRQTPRKAFDIPAIVRHGIEEKERINTYVMAINYLSNAYSTDNVVGRLFQRMSSLGSAPVRHQYSFPKPLKTGCHNVRLFLQATNQ